MADKLMTIDMKTGEADGASVVGKVVNIYNTYTNALAHSSTGLVTVKDVNRLDGTVGSAITQTAKTAGPTVDNNGMLVVYLDDGGSSQDYYLNGDLGRGRFPQKIVVQ